MDDEEMEGGSNFSDKTESDDDDEKELSREQEIKRTSERFDLLIEGKLEIEDKAWFVRLEQLEALRDAAKTKEESA
jgi:hypothetical protein